MSTLSNIAPSMKRANSFLEKMMVILTPTGVILGLLLGRNVSWMKPIVSYLFGFLTFSSAISINLKDFSSTIKKPAFLVCFSISSLLCMPLISILLARIVFNDIAIISGYALIRAIPTAVVGTVWASIFSGNMAIALSILIVDTIIAPFLTPFMLEFLVGTSIPLDTVGMMKSLLFMVVIPSILGMITNQITHGEINKEVGPCLKPISKICLLFVIMINTSQVADQLIDNASWEYMSIAFVSLLLACIGYFVGYFFSTCFKFYGKDRVSITFAVAMRNVSAALVLAIDYLPPAGTLPVIFGIVFQQTTSAVIGNMLFKRKR